MRGSTIIVDSSSLVDSTGEAAVERDAGCAVELGEAGIIVSFLEVAVLGEAGVAAPRDAHICGPIQSTLKDPSDAGRNQFEHAIAKDATGITKLGAFRNHDNVADLCIDWPALPLFVDED